MGTSAPLWDSAVEQLIAWLQSLPKPIGIIAVSDARARQLLQACLTAGIAVPEQVALIGIDNDPLTRSLTRVPLSSVIQGTETMHHRITDFNAGRPAVDQQASSLAFQGWQQGAGLLQILVIQVQRGGQLAFQLFEHLADFRVAGALHDQGRGAKGFVLQGVIGKKFGGIGDE